LAGAAERCRRNWMQGPRMAAFHQGLKDGGFVEGHGFDDRDNATGCNDHVHATTDQFARADSAGDLPRQPVLRIDRASQCQRRSAK
jgi:hypothetical protein